MHIEIYDNGIEIEDIKDVPHRTACRGIVKKDGLYLLTKLNNDIHMFPGGGIEANEVPEEACIREVLEETGITVKVVKETVRITEYFIDSMWTNIYFICEYVEQTNNPSLTDEEKELGLETVWMTELELLDTFENNMTKHVHGPNVHNREFLGFINSIEG